MGGDLSKIKNKWLFDLTHAVQSSRALVSPLSICILVDGVSIRSTSSVDISGVSWG